MAAALDRTAPPVDGDMKLPQFQSPDRIFQMLQSQWAAIINPVLSNPASNPRILPNVVLTSGVNIINTGLGQMQQGWIITDRDGTATVYRSQPFNDKTLVLTASAAVTISLEVF